MGYVRLRILLLVPRPYPSLTSHRTAINSRPLILQSLTRADYQGQLMKLQTMDINVRIQRQCTALNATTTGMRSAAQGDPLELYLYYYGSRSGHNPEISSVNCKTFFILANETLVD
jgi:hypothetical protein